MFLIQAGKVAWPDRAVAAGNGRPFRPASAKAVSLLRNTDVKHARALPAYVKTDLDVDPSDSRELQGVGRLQIALLHL